MTDPPGNLADRPAGEGPQDVALSQPDDLLSELLRSVRLSGERVAAYRPPGAFSIGFAGFGSLYFIEEGEIELRLDGDPRVERASRGDVVLFPRGDAHHVSDVGERPAGVVRWLSGTFRIGDPQASHLLRSLPPMIVLAGEGAPEGLEVARRMLVIEMQSPSQGSAVMISRILDLIFIQILRTWAAGEDAEPNWLAGAFDPQIGLSLSVIHRDPAHDWTVEELARACNLSRSVFAERFVARVGKPPATYLAHVRLDAATDLLRDTSLSVVHVAERVGYTSEAAFSRAFKNRYGMPPARWRRGRARTSDA
ncbi:AraC family transcriptional regulator [Actinomadura barringtoniae]|uniref:AraC family transcriptional regulator n=1 Tax=Actinomadura barringtoniae TaxID=1427535 RepID=A0A939PSY7_9ACTN|nr:AraC family transcriptional regulator [Actinomadura barringtoniae]MBO2455718.1 AraC family transcriptional regulator [Actinomadura barringtoniae]